MEEEKNGPRLNADFLDPRSLARACASSAAFEAAFGTEAKCQRWWIEQRWPGGFECPACRGRGRWDAKRRGYECQRCRRFTSLTAGTRLAYTKKPLRTWFEAIYLIVQRGVNARTLQRELGLTYKAAWTWGHKLRSLLGELAVPEELRPPREEHHSRFDAERRWCTPLPPACGCTKLARRDWQWPDEMAEERAATRAALRAALGDPDLLKRPVLLRKPDEPHSWSGAAHYELLATCYGSVSEKHLRAYLDELSFRRNRRWRALEEGFELVARAAAAEEPRTYRKIVDKKAPEGYPLAIFDTRQRPRRSATRRAARAVPRTLR